MNSDRLNYRYWQRTDWHNENSPLEAVYCNIVDGCDPTIAVSDFEFCTGLKDKYDLLVYEGDYVTDSRWHPYLVVWCDASGCFYLQNTEDEEDILWITTEGLKDYYIIGNKHEGIKQNAFWCDDNHSSIIG